MFRSVIQPENKSGNSVAYHNGHKEQSPNSSQLSVHADETLVRTHKQQTTQQVTTVTKVVHEVKHFRPDGALVDYVAMPLDVQHSNSDGQSVDYVSMPMHSRSQFINYNHSQHPVPAQHMYVADGTQYHARYQDYEHYPQTGHYANSAGGGQNIATGTAAVTYLTDYMGAGSGPTGNDRSGTPQSPNEHSASPSPLTSVAGQQHGMVPSVAYLQASHYDEMTDYRITPSPGVQVDPRYGDEPAMVYGYVAAPTYGVVPGGPNATYASRPIIYDESLNGTAFVENSVNLTGAQSAIMPRMFESEQELQKQMSQLSMHGHGLIDPSMATSPREGDGFNVAQGEGDQHQPMRWRDPNLSEVISFLNNPNNVIKANAAAYLQHLCYMDDPNKQRTRTLGGIPPLVRLLSHETPEVHRNACGALRNLSYGRQNDENKRAIKNANGIAALIALLRRTNESDVKELVTGVIWNMSSCEDLKRSIIDDGLSSIVSIIIKPHSGWDPVSPGETCWSTVFRNASGVLRNVSSAGEYARSKLRECEGLVDSLLYVVRCAIEKSNIGNKIVENCVCILRNLSYRCQEVDDPNYDKNPIPSQSRSSSVASSPKGENLGCFGASKKKKEANQNEQKDNLSVGGSSGSRNLIHRNDPPKGYELLWQPDVVQSYLALLQSCSNPETLEAAAGAIQNLAACYWQPSIEIRAAVRKEKGLPILVELLRMEVDRVVCAVATALRNLAIDQRNKELIGKYAMRDLVQKLPSGNPQHDQGTSDDTIAAVLATINEVIKKNAEFSRSLLDAGGVERLMNVTRQRQKYTPCVLKFASQVLFTMWQHQELRDVYKKQGWKEQDFVTKTVAARNAAPNSPSNANSTLNRPMASQGRTRYEDRTIKRNAGGNGDARNNGVLSLVSQSGSGSVYQRGEDIPLGDNSYQDGAGGTSANNHRMYVTGNGPTHPN